MRSIVKQILGAVLVGALVTGAAVARMMPNAGACPAKESGTVSVSVVAEEEDITTSFKGIYEVSEDGTTWFAAGVRIYNASTNELYGITNSEGVASIRVRPGTRIRAVEPHYGRPPYISNPIYDDKGIIARWIVN